MTLDYLAWCDKVRPQPVDSPGLLLSSANKIKIIALDDGEEVLLKEIRSDVGYIPRLKVLGEAVYSLLDYHLNPEQRIAPNVCPVGPDTLWRQFIPGLPGELWRGELYKEKRNLDLADLAIIDRVLESKSAERIALLDFITLFQDRSARNWIIDGNGGFFAIDNGIFWPYKGRHVDREAIRTDSVEHLRPPMEAIVSYEREFEFKIGLFSSLFAGNMASEMLLSGLRKINWAIFENELAVLISDSLEYPANIVDDGRFRNIGYRAEWILKHGRYPTTSEVQHPSWQIFTEDVFTTHVWEPEWEKE